MAQRHGAQATAAAAAAAAPAPVSAAPVGAATPAAMVRPAVMPETYDGSGDWIEYHHYFEQCAQINRWQDADKAQFLAVRLRGPAQRFFATPPAARRANWQHVSADMGQRFLPPGTALQCKAKFQSRRRAIGENLASLADDLRKLVVQGYPNMPDQDREELVPDQFIETVTPVALRVPLRENPPATVQAAVETALHLERVWGDLDMPAATAQRLVGPYGETPQQQLVAAVAPSQQPPDKELVRLLTKLETRLSSLENRRPLAPPGRSGESDPRQGTPPTCWGCGRIGHIQRHCRTSRSGNGRGRISGPPSQRPPSRPQGNGQ